MIDVDKLLEPIPGDLPAGPDLRLIAGDTTVDTIEDARRMVDPELDPDGRGKDPDWVAAGRTSEVALAESTKDLQIAAYLTESLAYQDGFPGVLAGLGLIRELLDRFWESVHPGVEDGEIIFPVRARWISWIGTSREFLAAVKSIPITSGPGVEERGWGDYEDTDRVDSAGMQADQSAYNEMIEQGRIPSSTWQSLVAATPIDRLVSVLDAVGACEAELRALNALCEQKFPEDAPNMVELSGLFYDCRQYLEKRVQGAAPAEAEAGSSDDGATASQGASAGGGSGDGPIASRDEAFRRLREAAEFLRRTEPHSPVPYLVERAVTWGNMPFQEMLQDVLKDDKARASILETLGMTDS